MIERRWAIVATSVVAALILILSVALKFSLGDSDSDSDGGPGGPHGIEFAQGGFESGAPEGGAQPMPPGSPEGGAPMPHAPQGAVPPSGGQGSNQ